MMWDNSGVHMMVPFNQGTLKLTGFDKINEMTEGKLNDKGMELPLLSENWNLPNTFSLPLQI